jgi:hypothetical protein
VREGDILPLRIIRIERDRHRLGLSLKQARDRGEIMGFNFGPDGEVTYVPEDIKAAFKDELTALLREAKETAEAEAQAAMSEDGETSTDGVDRPERSEREPIISLKTSSQIVEEEEEEEPQTQMAAAFAALKMEQLASEAPPEETKA